MTITFRKPAEARQCEARARAAKRRVRIEVVDPQRCYRTKSQSGNGTYWLRRVGRGWSCDCEGYHYTGMCKHIGALERRAERERWNFGVIAPRPT